FAVALLCGAARGTPLLPAQRGEFTDSRHGYLPMFGESGRCGACFLLGRSALTNRAVRGQLRANPCRRLTGEWQPVPDRGERGAETFPRWPMKIGNADRVVGIRLVVRRGRRSAPCRQGGSLPHRDQR